MKSEGIHMDSLRRAVTLIGLPVKRDEELLGQVAGIVYDTGRMVFGVQLQTEGVSANTVPAFLPVRALDCTASQVLRVVDQTEAVALTEDHQSVFGLPVTVAETRNVAYIQDVFIDVHARRVAAFELSAVRRSRAKEHARQIEGQQVERLGDVLVITPEVLHELAISLHTPVILAS